MRGRTRHLANKLIRKSRGRRVGSRPPILAPALCAATLLMLAGMVGCGTNVQELLYQTASAAGRTYLDQLLTDVANSVAARCEREDTPADGEDDGGNGGDGSDVIDDGDDVVDGGGAPFDELTGDPTAGEPLYASCAMCHCADASGGCVPGATGLVGVIAETLDEYLRGDAPHPSSDLTDQEIVDLEAYLASLGG